MGVGRGCPSQPGEGLGRGCAPSQKKIILALNMVSFGAFWMVFFYSSAICFTRKTGIIWFPSPYFFLIFRFKKDLVHFPAFWRRQKFHAAGPVLVRPSECITLHLVLIARRLHRFSIVRRFLLKLRLTSCAGVRLDIAK